MKKKWNVSLNLLPTSPNFNEHYRNSRHRGEGNEEEHPEHSPAVYPPKGKVTLACPEATADETIRLYLTSKIGWIRRQRKVLEEKERQSPREYVSRETHYFLGKAYLLKIIATEGPNVVKAGKKFIEINMHPNTSKARREE